MTDKAFLYPMKFFQTLNTNLLSVYMLVNLL